MKNTINSKRAQISEALILISVVALCVSSLYAVYSFQNQFSSKLAVPEELLIAYQNHDKFQIYSYDAARISINEAFSKSLIGSTECKIIANENIPIWKEDCILDSAFNEYFRKEIDSELRKSLPADNFKIVLGNRISIEFEEKTVNISGEKYNGTYKFHNSFLIDNPVVERPSEIYFKLKSRMEDCNGTPNFDSCVNRLSLNGYLISCSSDKYLICTLMTKKNYFHDGKFGKIESRFAVEL